MRQEAKFEATILSWLSEFSQKRSKKVDKIVNQEVVNWEITLYLGFDSCSDPERATYDIMNLTQLIIKHTI